MEKYDAIIVLGRGIDKEGNISDSAKATVEEAVKFFNDGKANYVIFSGKLSYRSTESFPLTEAEGMSRYAKSLGLSEESVLLETESVSTITNICNIKRQILIPHNWHQVVLISVDPVYKRAYFMMHRLLGSNYKCDLFVSSYKFPEDKYQKLKISEEAKMKEAKSHFKGVTEGDDLTMSKKSAEYLKNWKLKNVN